MRSSSFSAVVAPIKIKKPAKSTAMPMSPITKMKMENGIPGMKKGGKARAVKK